MSLDKADPVAVYGAYIGNYREQATFKILTSTGKIVAMGAAMIDEKTLLKKTPTRASDPDEFIELEEEVRDDTKIYSYDGKTSGPVTDSRVQVCPDVEAGEQAADDAARVTQPAAVTRPQRQAKQAVRFDPAVSASAPQRKSTEQSQRKAIDAPLLQQPKVRPKMMVPREMWPRYACKENAGAGWSVEVLTEYKDRVQVRFTEAKSQGREWQTEWMKPAQLVPLPSTPSSSAAEPEVESTKAQLMLHASAINSPAVPNGLTLQELELYKEVWTKDEPVHEFIEAAQQIDAETQGIMKLLAHVAHGGKGIPKVLVTIRGVPTWMPLPNTLKQAMSLPTWPSWQQAMETFIDRTVDGFLPVAPEVTKGNPISRVKWVYTYATNAEGDLVYKARLVWAHKYAGTQPGGSEFEQNTMSNVAKALHWKALIHTALVDGPNDDERLRTGTHVDAGHALQTSTPLLVQWDLLGRIVSGPPRKIPKNLPFLAKRLRNAD
jgi:hypothetical protein